MGRGEGREEREVERRGGVGEGEENFVAIYSVTTYEVPAHVCGWAVNGSVAIVSVAIVSMQRMPWRHCHH